MIETTYQIAVQLRARAERTCAPELYRRAAAEFAALQMFHAERRCLERAAHYERYATGLPRVPATTQ